MNSFTTLRSILSTTASPSIESNDDRKCNSPDRYSTTHKVGDKRKAAFQAWHQKKMAQMITSDRTIARVIQNGKFYQSIDNRGNDEKMDNRGSDEKMDNRNDEKMDNRGSDEKMDNGHDHAINNGTARVMNNRLENDLMNRSPDQVMDHSKMDVDSKLMSNGDRKNPENGVQNGTNGHQLVNNGSSGHPINDRTSKVNDPKVNDRTSKVSDPKVNDRTSKVNDRTSKVNDPKINDPTSSRVSLGTETCRIGDQTDLAKHQLRQFLLTNASAPTNTELSHKSITNQLKVQSCNSGSLATPKLSRHNDAAFYPNIQCILCHEWVCSRNRYMHIESHFQYRPYKCSVCGYDNRKQIFIELHINRVHKGAAQIVYTPDSELEKRAWTMAERCLEHTRQVLLGRQMDKLETETTKPESISHDLSIANKWILTESTSDAVSSRGSSAPLLAPYSNVYRPKIYNNQRSEKSNLIEESRMLGLIPDFSEVTAREERCRLCDTHVLRTPALLEEHARAHLSSPGYGCSVDACTVMHHSKNFVMRHMKEVHRVRRAVYDALENDERLLQEYLAVCARCFPNFFSSDFMKRVTSEKFKCKLHDADGTSKSTDDQSTSRAILNAAKMQRKACFGCRVGLRLSPDRDADYCASCYVSDHKMDNSNHVIVSICEICKDSLIALDRWKLLANMESHSLKHCHTAPFGCVHCPYTHWRRFELENHYEQTHDSKRGDVETLFRWQSMTDWRRTWRVTFENCYSISDERWTDKSDEYIECNECSDRIESSVYSRIEHFFSRHKHSSGIYGVYLQCAYCDENFTIDDKDALKCHLNDAHANNAAFICFGIDFIRNDISSALEHLRSRISRYFDLPRSNLDPGPKPHLVPVVVDSVSHQDPRPSHDLYPRPVSNQDLNPGPKVNQGPVSGSHQDPRPVSNHDLYPRFTSRQDSSPSLKCDQRPLSGSHHDPIPQHTSSPRPRSLQCKLCHSEIVDDQTSHILHLQYHLTTPVYKCRSCAYTDVDADRMKTHVDQRHDGKVAYYAQTLPFDQETKALRLVDWCFGLK